MATLILAQTATRAHPHVEQLKRDLFAALNAAKPADLTPIEFDLAVALAEDLGL